MREIWVVEQRKLPSREWVIVDHFIDRIVAESELSYCQNSDAKSEYRVVKYTPVHN